MRNDSVGTPPEKISRWKFPGMDRFLRKNSFFHKYLCLLGEKIRRPAATSILMPPRFHIASSLPYVPNFSGVPQKLTFCWRFGLQLHFWPHSVIHILKAVHLWDKMSYLEAVLVHPVRRQNFSGKWDLTFYNIWDCVLYNEIGIANIWRLWLIFETR